MTWTTQLYSLVFTVLPHHLISRFVGALAYCRASFIKQPFINWFIRQYGVNMQEAANSDPQSYENFNAFFTRELAPGARVLADSAQGMLCPVDGAISEIGRATRGQLLQAKGEYYTVARLLADQERAELFQEALFATLYLAPKDYHRIHMPVAGTLTRMTYVPGRLFSVNNKSVRAIPELFARNERVIAYFDTELGELAMVLVGAMIVASIKTTWAGVVAPGGQLQHWDYPAGEIVLNAGDEMGQFLLGSTVILLLNNPNLSWELDLTGAIPVKMGQLLAKF